MSRPSAALLASFTLFTLAACAPVRAPKLTAKGGGPAAKDTPAASALFADFIAAKASGKEPILPDFSYAGYHHAARLLPDVAELGPRFVVTAFGATANDGNYDDDAIQAAINAAADAGGGVVVFPAGRFHLSPDQDPERVLRIYRGHIVLKGAGAGDGGTELFMDQMKRGYILRVEPPKAERGRSATLAKIVADSPRETFSVLVDRAEKLAPGQWVTVSGGGAAYNASHWGALWPFPEGWTRIHKTGNQFAEIHRVKSLEPSGARTRVTFHEPLHLTVRGGRFSLRSTNLIEEIGIEDIRFTGNWASYPEAFVHHKDGIHDTGWSGVSFDHVANSWMRRCEFRDFNQSLNTSASTAVTFENLIFSGKKGHTSIHVRRGYGILTKDSVDSAGHHHGPSLGYWAAGTVYLRHKMKPGQQIDSHSGSPYATLFDAVDGGILSGSGGPFPSLPHHGLHLVFWNFIHKAKGPKRYDFWSTQKRVNNTFARPLFVGFVSATPVTFLDEASKVGANESFGRLVTPASLFEAQLALRRQPAQVAAAASQSPIARTQSAKAPESGAVR
jgi:Domain of unknown function (DUF4955)/Pectate lyase superfamily protein